MRNQKKQESLDVIENDVHCTNAVNPPKERQSKAGYFNIKCT